MDILFEDSLMLIEHVVVGPLDNNVFVVRCKQTGEGILFDAADEDELLYEMCLRNGVQQVITTHGHFDHIGAVAPLREKGINVAIHELDSSMLPTYDCVIIDEQTIKVGELHFDILHTPGHTPGSISIVLQNSPFLFTGDTLFPGGPGATHFPGGDFPTIIDSIEKRLMVLPANTIVLPGHGTSTTIGEERPNIDMWAARGW